MIISPSVEASSDIRFRNRIENKNLWKLSKSQFQNISKIILLKYFGNLSYYFEITISF